MSAPAITVPVYAPLWRRLAAAAYDLPLLVVVWVLIAALFATAQAALPQMRAPESLRGVLGLAAGAGFFGWFWTRGGQSPGMRAWNIRLQRADGAALRWPVAVLRFAAMLAVWVIALMTPLLIYLSDHFGQTDPAQYRHIAVLVRHAQGLSLFFASLCVLMWLWQRLDRAHRLPQDLVASVVVVRS